MEGFVAREEDYTIDGEVTSYAIEELLRLGRIEELFSLLQNAHKSSSVPAEALVL